MADKVEEIYNEVVLIRKGIEKLNGNAGSGSSNGNNGEKGNNEKKEKEQKDGDKINKIIEAFGTSLKITNDWLNNSHENWMSFTQIAIDKWKNEMEIVNRSLNTAATSWSNSVKGAETAYKNYIQNVQGIQQTAQKNEKEYKERVNKEINLWLDTFKEIPNIILKAFGLSGIASMLDTYVLGPIFDLFKNANKRELEILIKEQEIAKARLDLTTKALENVQEMAGKLKEYWNQTDKSAIEFGRTNMLSAEQTDILRKNLLASNAAYAELNKTSEDAIKIFSNLREGTNRAVNLTTEEIQNIMAVGNIIGDDVINNAQVQLNIFNKSASNVSKTMFNTANEVAKMGLSVKKSTSDIVNNFKLLQEFQFKEGVEGYRRMAVLAQDMRFNLNSMSNMLNKIQSGGLEGVIKQTAQLQVLGGNLAKMADPFALMYNAFADPETMVKNVRESLKGFGSVDIKTGETIFVPQEMIRLKAFANAMNMEYSNVLDMVRQGNKKNVVGREIRSGSLTDQEKSAITNAATRDEKGNWTVTTISGEKMNVSDIKDSNDVAKILSNNKEDQAIQYAKSQLSVTEEIDKTTKLINAMLGGRSWDYYAKIVDEENKNTLKSYSDNQLDMIANIEDVIGRENSYQKQQLDVLKDIRKYYLDGQWNLEFTKLIHSSNKDDKAKAMEMASSKLKDWGERYNKKMYELVDAEGNIQKWVINTAEVQKKLGRDDVISPFTQQELDAMRGQHFNRGLLPDKMSRDLEDFFVNEEYRKSMSNSLHNFETPVPRLDDGVIFKDGEVKAVTSENDNIYVAQKGGVLHEAMSNNMSKEFNVTVSGSITMVGSNGSTIDLNIIKNNPSLARNLAKLIENHIFNSDNATWIS